MKEQPSKGVLGIPQAFLTLPGACHYCKHDVLTPWGSSLLWQFFPNDSGYETRFVIPLTSDLYSFFFFFGVLTLYNDILVSAVQWLDDWLSFLSISSATQKKIKIKIKPARYQTIYHFLASSRFWILPVFLSVWLLPSSWAAVAVWHIVMMTPLILTLQPHSSPFQCVHLNT